MTFRPAVAALLLLSLFLFFWQLGSVPLFDLDEGLYATCSRQMVVSGDWVTPRLNSRPLENPGSLTVPFFEKPILIYWLAAGSMRLFGISPWAARLPLALAALAVTGLVIATGARWFGPRAGLLAGLIYATSPITILDARQLTTDGLLVLWFTLAMLAFQAGRRSEGTPAAPRFALLFWLSCAMAILTKGAVGLLLPVLTTGVFVLVERLALRVRWGGPRGARMRFLLGLAPRTCLQAALRTLRPLSGLLLVVVIILPWHLLIWRAGGRDALGHTWVQEYLIRQHLGRFRGLDTVHNAPLPSYLLFLLIGFFPWSCFVPVAFRTDWNHPSAVRGMNEADLVVTSQRPVPNAQFLLTWFWTVFVFFSLAAAKLPTYIAPAYPAAALLMGRWLDRALCAEVPAVWGRSLRRGAVAATVISALLVVGAVIGPRFVPAGAPISEGVRQLALHLTLLLVIGNGAAWLCFSRNRSSQRGRQAGVATLAITLTLVVGVGSMEGYAVVKQEILGPYQQAAVAAGPDAARGLPVVFYHIIPRRPSMLFYVDYSPWEHKEEPLMPFVRRFVPSNAHVIDVVTSLDVYRRLLLPELSPHPEVAVSILSLHGESHSGWVLLRLNIDHGSQ